MQPRKTIREVHSVDDIVRRPSTNARERKQYIQLKQAGGCDLCGGHARLAFYPRNPKENKFNIQTAGIRISLEQLDAEIAKCVIICVSCRMRMLGEHRAPFSIKNKELFYELREAYYVPPTKFEGKKK